MHETLVKHALKVCTLGFGSFFGEDKNLTTHSIPCWWEIGERSYMKVACNTVLNILGL